MRRLRHLLVRRLCTALLLAGVATSLVPTAVALDVRVEALGELLGDQDAVVSALEAAQNAPTPETAAETFAARYVQEAHEGLSEAAIVEILLGEAFRHVAPVSPDAAFVPAPPVSPAPRVSTGSSAVLPVNSAPVATHSQVIARSVTVAGPEPLERSCTRARAP